MKKFTFLCLFAILASISAFAETTITWSITGVQTTQNTSGGGIVDTDLEQVSFFFMGYKEPFVVTFKELENKGDNPDEDLYKAIATLSKKV